MAIEKLDIPISALVNTVTCVEMPDDALISYRTQRTRTIGAFYMLHHLAEGEWDPKYQAEMAEFLVRIVANAERQGVAIQAPIAD